jgi:aconitate hydratase
MPSIDTFKTRRELTVGDKTYVYYSLAAAEEAGIGEVRACPAP